MEVEVECDGEGEGGDGRLDGFPHINGRSIRNGNGHVVEMESLSSLSSFSEELNSSVEGEEGEEKEGEEEEEDATTPKVDKGKRKLSLSLSSLLSPKTFMGEPERGEEKGRRRGGYSDDERGGCCFSE